MVDIDAARAFMTTHARLLDRRRFACVVDGAPGEGVLAALAAYGNDDGGLGWGMEPDLRTPASQPAGALHAFEAMADAAPATSPLAGSLCDWLDSVTLDGGGLPFVTAGAEGPATAPWFAGASTTEPSLFMTSAVAGHAHRVAAHDPAVAGSRWLERATDFCLREVARMDGSGGAYELMYVLRLLDALAPRRPEVEGELERVTGFLPPSAELPVAGGLEDERLRPLDFAPHPGPVRERLAPDVIERDRERLAAGQRDDGGWEIDFAVQSPASALEWRGYKTLEAVATLRA